MYYITGGWRKKVPEAQPMRVGWVEKHRVKMGEETGFEIIPHIKCCNSSKEVV
jgi:hypothetical protein